MLVFGLLRTNLLEKSTLNGASYPSKGFSLMNNFLTVDYSEILPFTDPLQIQTTGEFKTLHAIDCDWGQMKINQLSLPEITLVKFEGQIRQNLHLRKRAPHESTTVDSCIFLDGSVDSDFAGMSERISMRKGMHNFIYKPEAIDDHYVKAQDGIKLLHLSIDRFYYSSLLCEKEKWSADLKERLLNKKLIYGSPDNMQISPQMLHIVNDLLNCPLTGNLRNLMLEAKIIEFIALQLNQLVKEIPGKAPQKLKTSDRDALYALREFLHESYTKNHSLKNLAMCFGINEFKLKKGFKELFGTTVFDYLHDLRMEHAKQLLAANEVLVNEVSGMVGYKNANHFSTAFKRKYGLNPTQLRN